MFESFPRAGIGSFPTPVEPYPGLGDALGVSDLWVKQDGVTGERYGGNKVRKLDFLLGDALDRGCRRVWTSGGIGSHHVLATCVYAREVGLEPHAAQFPQPVTDHVRETLRALAATDPELTLAGSEPRLLYHMAKARIATRLRDDMYYVPPGGSSPVGTLGFVAGALELAEQIAGGEVPDPDVIVVPTSSGGTLAGLTVGRDLAGLDARVVGVRVIERYVANRWSVARLARKTAALLGDAADVGGYGRGDIALLDGYLGAGYGEPTPEGERVTGIAAERGLELDPTYTAKTVAAVADRFDDERVLYWHTLSATDPTAGSGDAPVERLPASHRRFLTAEES